MTWDDFAKAFNEARNTLAYADAVSNDLARMLLGRMRKVDIPWLLTALKRELQDWDMHRKTWKS
jgi:hypothetical protein